MGKRIKGKKWTLDELKREARKYNSRNAFKNGSRCAYNACQRRGILNEICKHMKNVLTYWTDEMLRKEALKYKTRSEFYERSNSAYNLSQKRGILDDVCSHMEGNVKWTDEMLFAEARKYKTRYEFEKGSESAYQTCRKRGILDDTCSHMEQVLTYWTDEMFFSESRKYKTRYEFEKGSKRAYSACQRRGILNDICDHMEVPPHWEKPHCVYLVELINKDDSRYYYVGQTHNLKNRMKRHLIKSTKSPINIHLQKPEWNRMKLRVLLKDLSFEDSLKLEQKTIDKFIQNNMNLLNTIGVKV